MSELFDVAKMLARTAKPDSDFITGYSDYMNGEDFNHDYSDSYESEYNRGWLKAKRDCADSKDE